MALTSGHPEISLRGCSPAACAAGNWGLDFFVRGVQAIFGQLVVQFGGLLAVNFSHDFPTLFDPIVLHEDFKSWTNLFFSMGKKALMLRPWSAHVYFLLQDMFADFAPSTSPVAPFFRGWWGPNGFLSLQGNMAMENMPTISCRCAT